MPAVGVEPTRYCYHEILSLARLPIPSRRHIFVRLKYNTIKKQIMQVFFWKKFDKIHIFLDCNFVKVQKTSKNFAYPFDIFATLW